MLFTAEIRMSEILGSNFQTDRVPFWSVKSVVIVVFIQVFCRFFLASSEVKTQKPFPMPPGNKGGIYLETQPLPGTQRMWSDHQVPLIKAPNQLGSSYSKWYVAGRPLRGSSQPGSWRKPKHKREDQTASCGGFPAGATQDNISCSYRRLPEQLLPRVAPDRAFPSSLLTTRASDSTTLLWENKPLSLHLWPLTSNSKLFHLPASLQQNFLLDIWETHLWNEKGLIQARYLVSFNARTHQNCHFPHQRMLHTWSFTI